MTFPSKFQPAAAARIASIGLVTVALGAVAVRSIEPSQARAQGVPPPAAVGKLYEETCAACHGADLSGGRGPSLFAEALLAQNSDEALHARISEGVQGGEMPAFKDILTSQQIYQLIAYLRTQSVELKGKPVFVPDPNNQVLKTEKATVKIEVVTTGLDTPWGLAFLPDGRLLVTERSGHLRIVDKAGKLDPTPVKGTPVPWVRQDAGMLDVAIHPDYAKNGWIYLAYTDVMPGYVAPATPVLDARGRPISPPSMTVLIRGKLSKTNAWTDTQEIFRGANNLYTPNGSHYGTRFLFDGKGHVFYSIGERGEMSNAQKLDNPLGKIHRVNDDGSVPKDNPFVNTAGAVPTIWSYGHRNPQGLSFNPVTGDLWESEHGPTGGDEINVVDKGKNYGWGVVSMGIQPGITERSAPGMVPPVAYYTPTIAPSGITFYKGDKYPGWKNNLFVAALAGQQLRRIETNGREVTHQEIVYQQYGRTRAVTTGPDGLLYVLLQNPTGGTSGVGLSAATPGMVIRLVPQK